MQFLTSLLGETGGSLLTALLALGFVLVLVVFGVWVLKAVFRASESVVRVRGRRLSMVEQVPVDGKRRLLIIRRDNVEHLILTGGPQDLVIESGIPVERTLPAAQTVPQRAEPPAPPPATDDKARPDRERQDLERLRTMIKAPVARSLRHTGLLRSITQPEPRVIPHPIMAGDKADLPQPDSAKSVRGDTGGRTVGGGRHYGDGASADN